MMKKAVLQFTACCMAVGVSVASFSSAVLADTNTSPSATLAGVDAAEKIPDEDADADGEAIQPETVTTLAGAEGTEAPQEAAADTGTSEVTGSYTFGYGVVTAQEEEESEEETTAQTAGETIPESSDSEMQVVEPTGAEEAPGEENEEESEEISEEAGEDVSEEETEPETTLAGVTLVINADKEADEADEDADEDAASEKAEEVKEDDSMNGSQVFALCEDYVNVRSAADIDSEVIGKLYNYNEATILGKYGDWYKIQSGNVTGYVNAEYVATGEDADLIAQSVGYRVATVQTEALMVRTAPDEDAESIDIAYEAEELEVLSYEGDWMKVILPNGTIGYVNAGYVDYNTYYSTGETLEEEQERLDEEWLAYLAEQEAAAEAAAAEAAAQAAYYEPVYTETTYTEPTYTYTETTYVDSSSVDAAYQRYLEAQAAADAACQQADEQLVYDTYNAAVAAYQEYLNAVAALDAASYTYTEPTYTETYTEPTYTYTETTTYVDSSSVDAAYQNYLDAQAAADAACLQADESLVYETYDAAVAAYQEYLNACNGYDSAVTETTTVYETVENTGYAEPAYEETYVEETYVEPVSTTTSSSGSAIASFATQFVGNPYVYGGTSLTNGADCSGFTQSVFANFGISIPRTAAAQASGGTAVSLSDIQPGDLLFYSNGSGIGHVSMYIGNGQVVHASTSSTGIIISSVDYRTPVSARRYW